MGLLSRIWPFGKKELPTVDAPKPRVLYPQFPLTHRDLDEKYAAMAEEPHSAIGGPIVAGRLKYEEQVKLHGKLG